MTESPKPGAWLLTENRFGKYCIPRASAHRPVARILLRGEVSESPTIEFITSHTTDGDIVHAGAYFGDFLPALSRSISCCALVWTFEPNPSNFEAAVETCKLNRLNNVRIFPTALGRIHEVRQMRWKAGEKELGGMTKIVEQGVHPRSEVIDVEVAPLDAILPDSRKISAIHLDVEGFEAEALEGAMGMIRNWKPVIVIETDPQQWVDQNLLPLGYHRIGKCDVNTILTHGGISNRATP